MRLLTRKIWNARQMHKFWLYMSRCILIEKANIILFRYQRERAGTFDSILDIVARKKHSPGNRRRGGISKVDSHTRAPLVSHMSKLGESGRSLRPVARRTFGVARSPRGGIDRTHP